MKLEEKVRLNIDNMLINTGYAVQDAPEFDPTASLGVILLEANTDSGPVDCQIFIDGEREGIRTPDLQLRRLLPYPD